MHGKCIIRLSIREEGMNWCLKLQVFKYELLYIFHFQVAVYILNFHKLIKRECFDKLCITLMHHR